MTINDILAPRHRPGGRSRSVLTRIMAISVITILSLAGPAAAQTAASDGGVLVRVRGDVTVAAGERHDTVVVVDGDLTFSGEATTVVVVNGTATLDNATAGTLVIVSGDVDLGPGTIITGDVQLVNSDLDRDSAAVVEGEIRNDAGRFVSGFWIVGLLLMIGWAALAISAALALAALAPTLARTAGRSVTGDPGRTIGAGLVLWVAAPIVAMLAFVTIVGIPIALAVLLAVLPAFGFVGLLIAGVRVGEYLTAGGGGTGRPYLAATVGAVVLIVVGAVPVIGPVVIAFAAFLGSGALALHTWRAVRTGGSQPVPGPAPAGTQR